MDAWQTAEDIRAGRVSSVTVVSRALARIHDLQPDLNAFTAILDEAALASARDADAAVRRGEPLPPLHGVPVSVKDHIWMTGTPATNGSLVLRDFTPTEDAVPVARLRAAGAVIVGKTNNPEFCYRGFTDNLLFGLTRNPWDPQRTPGGSSGGAGASVAAGMTAIALGTDGGGSIRIPASFCGVVGHKPTFGLVPKEPGFKGWKTLSVDGPLSRSVRDAALMLSVMTGPSAADDLSYPGPPVSDYVDAVAREPDLRGLRVAWSADLGMLPVDPDVRSAFAQAVQVLDGLGCELVKAAPATAHPTELWNTIALAEGYSSEGPLLSSRELMSPGTAEIVEAGRSITGGQYVDALHERAAYTRVWAEFFEQYHVLVTPAMQLTAFPVGLQTPEQIEGRPVDPFFDDWCTICLPANLTGMPATVVPAGFGAGGRPVGLQVIGPRWADAQTLRVASAFERATLWSAYEPTLRDRTRAS
ncbi:amidase [Pedococcus sp. 5OH_020]|uniref:amidase n=1 Tax=Pedococcus sp. 5OH_020 TaxID=2989814 RepID=UPI0022E9C6A2|nr:amidase [Pedococcus sp. 5OH_020]